MKATQGTTYRMLGTRLNEIALQLEKLRQVGVTGKKLLVPSDDPASVRPVFTTRKQISNVDRYLDTMGKSLDTMQATDGQLNSVENIMQRAKEIMTNAINGSLNDADRTIFADEMAQRRKELLASANSMVDNKYLFAGYQQDTTPFVENPNYDPALYDANDSSTWPYLYQGDQNATSLEIGPGELMQVNLTGNNIFLGTSTWDPADPTNNSTASGRYDLFLTLTKAEEAIRNNDQAAMQTSMSDLEGAAEQNRQLRAQLGTQAARVESSIGYQQGVRIDLQQILSRYEDVNSVDVFNSIIQQETAFQAALNVTGRVSQISILDYL
ncbi:MAG: flagellar hook-associated protein FlgL [Proteobacteria bacterium]|nr:flagellar hook-associated protein FlgL [Pseudomonadota bacterium]